MNIFRHPVWKASAGLAGGFFGAFLGLFVSRVFLSNNVDLFDLGVIFGVNGLTALSVVLAVEGFTSNVPVNFSNPLRHVRSLIIYSMLFVFVSSVLLFVGFGLYSSEYSFLVDYWWLIVFGVVVSMLVGAGQAVEVVASMTGHNFVPVWRRTSVQFIGLGLFTGAMLMFGLPENMGSVFLWFLCAVVAGLVAVCVGLWLLVRGVNVPQSGLKETWVLLGRDYVSHNVSKLGLVLPRFIVPVVVLGLFGLTVNSEYVVLWTVVGLFAVMVSAVSRAYMSYHDLVGSWVVSLKVWVLIVLLPLTLAAVLNSQIVGLFGDGFSSLGGLLLVGLLSVLPLSVIDFMLARLRVSGGVRISSWLALLNGTSVVFGVVLFGGWFGLPGIMWSYVAVYTVFSIVMVVTVVLRERRMLAL